jgi:hypothetical protein
MMPASEDQVAAFESRVGASLPADYREYLLTTNGGAPNAPCYRGDVMDLYVQHIFSLLEDEQRGLIWEWQTASLPDSLRHTLIPVAIVNGGDRLLLSLVNGEVFFHDHELDTYSRIDDSFSRLLEKSHAPESRA